jgi:Leucine-rich repeat (LRR) protein
LSDEELMRSYASFLQTAPFRDEDYLPYTDRNELVLSRCPATADWLLDRLGGRRRWDSIDLSFTQTDDTAWLDPNTNWDIVRLNLESTKITDEALKGIARMPRLQELDISNCSITSEAIEELRAHPQLQTLWIAGTSVDDNAIDVLREIPKLTTVHASGCRVSKSGWSQLMQAVPRLKKSSTEP